MQVADNFYADFLCRQYWLIVELDGHSHDVAPERDVWRDNILNRAGYRVLHFSNEDVMTNADGVVEAIRLALTGPPLTPPASGRGTRQHTI